MSGLRQCAYQRGQLWIVLVPSPVQVGDLRAHLRVVIVGDGA
jgi:hypothetical protein